MNVVDLYDAAWAWEESDTHWKVRVLAETEELASALRVYLATVPGERLGVLPVRRLQYPETYAGRVLTHAFSLSGATATLEVRNLEFIVKFRYSTELLA